jgi:hypothetical protein
VQDKQSEASGKLMVPTFSTASDAFLFVLIFGLEDGGNIFVRNFGYEVMLQQPL